MRLEGIYERQDIPASWENMENNRVRAFDSVDDDVLGHGVAAQETGQGRKKGKAVSDAVAP
jgi:hypothetical protein